jgi:hypothetical protein
MSILDWNLAADVEPLFKLEGRRCRFSLFLFPSISSNAKPRAMARGETRFLCSEKGNALGEAKIVC